MRHGRTARDDGIVEALRPTNEAVVFVTHIRDSGRIADDIVVLDGGRVLEEGGFQMLSVASSLSCTDSPMTLLLR